MTPDSAAAGPSCFDLDHTSFAVQDATTWARVLRRELGAMPVLGETLPEFRYLQLYLGSAERGGRIELIEPVADGFLTRFLDRRGEGPHHLTFMVPDLRASVDRVRGLGARVTGENYSHPAWREAFIAPDAVHGVVIQLAQSDHAYPSPAELLASGDPHLEDFPSTQGATDNSWWTPVRDTPAGPGVGLVATLLASTDLTFSRRLFEGVLGAEASENDAGVDFHWPSGVVRTHSSTTPGVTELQLDDGPTGDLAIGSTPLRGTSERRKRR